MRSSIFLLFIVAFGFILQGCNDNDDKKTPPIITRFYEVKRIDCESNLELCNRRPGLKFTALMPSLSSGHNPMDMSLHATYEPELYSLTVCCDTIPALIDSLKMMHELLESWRRDKPEKERRTCNLPDTMEVNIFYGKNFAGTGEFNVLEFGKRSERFFFTFYTKEQFDKMMHDLEERFRTCCLN